MRQIHGDGVAAEAPAVAHRRGQSIALGQGSRRPHFLLQVPHIPRPRICQQQVDRRGSKSQQRAGRTCMSRQKCSASSRISSRRFRSGGTTNSMPRMRYYKSWWKCPSDTDRSKSWCVTEKTRTSTSIVRALPTGCTTRCCQGRRIFPWAASGISPSSSRNNVPPSACSQKPR